MSYVPYEIWMQDSPTKGLRMITFLVLPNRSRREYDEETGELGFRYYIDDLKWNGWVKMERGFTWVE